jgi:hemerythrin
MSLFTWDESFSVHNAEMDKQHQNLFDLTNKLQDAMGQRKGNEILPEVFDSLVKYTVGHFAAEEALLQKYNYPDLGNHKHLHADLIKQVSELQKKFQAGNLSISIETSNFLKQWLQNHIKEADQKYGAFLQQKGVR